MTGLRPVPTSALASNPTSMSTGACLVEEQPDDLSIAEAAAQLDVHYMTVYRYVRTAALPARRVAGIWRIRHADLEHFAGNRRAVDVALSPDPERPESRRLDTARGRRIAAQRAERLADRMIAGDRAGGWSIIQRAAVDGMEPSEIWLGLIGSALATIGDRWEAGMVSIGEEHTASAVATHLVGRLGGTRQRPGRTRGTVVVAAAPGDRHALPSALFAEALRDAGFEPVDLGADTPIDALVDVADHTDRLLAVGICATVTPNRSTRSELARGVTRLHESTGRPVFLGGAGLRGCRALGEDARSDTAADAMKWLELLAAPTRSGRSS